MSLEGIVKEIEDARSKEQARWAAVIKEQYESIIRAKEDIFIAKATRSIETG